MSTARMFAHAIGGKGTISSPFAPRPAPASLSTSAGCRGCLVRRGCCVSRYASALSPSLQHLGCHQDDAVKVGMSRARCLVSQRVEERHHLGREDQPGFGFRSAICAAMGAKSVVSGGMNNAPNLT